MNKAIAIHIAGMIPTALFYRYYQYSHWDKVIPEEDINRKEINDIIWNAAWYEGLLWPLSWLNYITTPRVRINDTSKMEPEVRRFLINYIRYQHWLRHQ